MAFRLPFLSFVLFLQKKIVQWQCRQSVNPAFCRLFDWYLYLLPTGAGARAPANVGPPPVLETSHQFAEYTYKNITSCDVCSQIMKGNTRQGLKCKLCRMNVHGECQDKVVKCQPKAKFSRMKSGSEMGDDESKISFYVTELIFEVLLLDLIVTWHWRFSCFRIVPPWFSRTWSKKAELCELQTSFCRKSAAVDATQWT